MSASGEGKASFLAFHLEYAALRGWRVPAIHVRACHWLEHTGLHCVLLCFRGFGKSTLLAEYNAWRYWRNRRYRILHQSADDQMAYKTSRDTQRVLRSHPYTKGMLPGRPGPVEQWWIRGADDHRNASMFAKGITSTTTSSRADECQNDDVEVPKNITNQENREKMRDRLGEQVHIMVPGARHLFIGTPHTHDSIYDEQIRLGADVLRIPMFEHEFRIEAATEATARVPFEPDFVFAGIHETATLLQAGKDYAYRAGVLTFRHVPGTLVDCYAGSAWPERFDGAEMLLRRRRTRTINAWDSQYQLHSKPLTQTRLNPERMPVYSVEPHFDRANKRLRLWLGQARIVGASLRWDPASGKLKSDVSAVALVLQDDQGRRYWHRAVALIGDVAEFGPDGKTIIGGQVHQIAEIVAQFHLRKVRVETNGIGTFSPTILRAAMRQRGVVNCAVVGSPSTGAKNQRILDSVEPLLMSQMLWCHTSVADGPAWEQMREWNPAVLVQPDDHLDALGQACTDEPERLGEMLQTRNQVAGEDWRPGAGVYEVELTV